VSGQNAMGKMPLDKMSPDKMPPTLEFVFSSRESCRQRPRDDGDKQPLRISVMPHLHTTVTN